jgi:hypothetical protein
MSNDNYELGYKPNEILPGSIYEKWYNHQISKKEAKKALLLGYSPSQWSSPKYQNYRDKSLFFAKLKLYFLHEVPFFREVVEDSENETGLAEDVAQFQRKIILSQAGEKCFKPIINHELLYLETKEIAKLEPSLSLVLKNSSTSWRKLKAEFELLVKNISQIRAQQSSSPIEDVKKQAKNRISQVLEKTKIENYELNSKYQNWATEIEKAENVSQIFQLEYHLIPLLEQINYFLHQNWFIKLSSQEIAQIKRIEPKDSWKIIQGLIEKKQEQLLINQVNKMIKFYQKLQDFTQQKFELQIHHLKLAEQILQFADILFPDSTWKSEKKKLQEDLKITFDELDNLQEIKYLQKSFSKSSSLEEQKNTLEKLQKSLQNLNQIKSLTKKELQIQTKVRKNLDLIQNKDPGFLTSLLPIIDTVSQNSLSPIPVENDKQDSFRNDSNSDLTPDDLQKWLVISAIVSLILILVWQWYRKKKEKEPFW